MRNEGSKGSLLGGWTSQHRLVSLTWPMANLLNFWGIPYLVGKIKCNLFFQGPAQVVLQCIGPLPPKKTRLKWEVVRIPLPFISHEVRPFGRKTLPDALGLGTLQSPWLLSTYPSPGMILQVGGGFQTSPVGGSFKHFFSSRSFGRILMFTIFFQLGGSTTN